MPYGRLWWEWGVMVETVAVSEDMPPPAHLAASQPSPDFTLPDTGDHAPWPFGGIISLLSGSY
jgi:hypothetical protein